MRDGATSAERDRIKDLERGVKQDRQANEILREVSAYFAQAPLAVWRQTATGQREFDRLFKLCPRLFVARQCMFTCTSGGDHRAIHGVESICRPLQITLSDYYARRAVRAKRLRPMKPTPDLPYSDLGV